MSINPNPVNQNLFQDLLQKNSFNQPVIPQVIKPAETKIKDTVSVSTSKPDEKQAEESSKQSSKKWRVIGIALALLGTSIYLRKRHKINSGFIKVADSEAEYFSKKAKKSSNPSKATIVLSQNKDGTFSYKK